MLTASKMYDCYYGDASTVETSVFINAEILVRLFFQAITQKGFALHRGAQTPFSWTRNIWVPTIFGGCGGNRRDRLSPSPFTLLNPPPFSSPSHFLHFFLLPPLSPLSILPAPCTPPYAFKATERRGAGVRGRDKVGVRVGKRGGRR